MTEQSLTISFANKQGLDNPYWLRMELVEEKTTMSVAEAGAIIDELYGTSICGESVPIDEVQEPTAPDWDAILAMANLPVCDPYLSALAGDSGAYDTQIKIYRSHQTEIYKLILSNGIAGAPRRVEERVVLNLAVENQSSLLLDTPIVGRPVIVWTDTDGPDIHIKGNLLYWEGNVDGNIRAEFNTVYDLLSVHVTGIENTTIQVIEGTVDSKWLGVGWYSGTETGDELTDVQDIQCEALAFYHYQYESLVLHKPELDESVDNSISSAICQQQGSTFVESGTGSDDGRYDEDDCKADCARYYPKDAEKQAECKKGCERECYKRVSYTTICTCSGAESTSEEDKPVSCPPGYNTGSRVGSATEDNGYKYIYCGADEVHEKAYYEEKCCHPWPFGMDTEPPLCKVHHKGFSGKAPDEDQTVDYKEKYGDNVNVISVGPKEGRCGETLITQDVQQANCCDEVEDLEWDSEESADVVDAFGAAYVYVLGGQAPLYWKVRGDGFYTNASHTETDAVTNGRGLRIYTNDACGSARITVEDGCSQTQGSLRSTNGQWLVVPEAEWPSETRFDNYDYFDLGPGGIGHWRFTKTESGYKYRQTFNRDPIFYASSSRYTSCEEACDDPTDFESIEEVIERAKEDRRPDVPQYFTYKVLWQFADEHDWDEEDWNKCDDGLMCRENRCIYNYYYPNWSCQHSVYGIRMDEGIDIWEWSCNR